MNLFLVSMFSPLVAAALSLIVFALSKVMRHSRPSGKTLVVVSLVTATICAGLSLAYTIAEMIRYEATTGYSTGNGPLGWIFISGPLSVAFGFLVALASWLLGWPPRVWKSQVRPNKSLERTREG